MNKSKEALLSWYVELGIDCFLEKNNHDKVQVLKDEIENGDKYNSNKQSMKHISKSLADKCSTVEELRRVVESFDELDIKKGAINTVFADGNPKSDIMLIGEAPGANEDKYGIPFCGQSGKLLDNILAAIKLDRKNYYITNTIFWRPPANRRPTTNEIDVCRPFVEKHVALVNPKIIILVGSTAVESLLDLKTPMGQLRKQNFKYSNQYLKKSIDTFVIFHPSYLLRQPSQKKAMWQDIQRIYTFYKKI
ncbi:uracil-DNA glycosylase [Rickettsiales endosymbiont of Trichoplax sp. H2]|uniref:uracil-DNA glycosylase n=1 Tax=Rickettsiales endosymbiont of Trichoplax sp. H2 TaxID=2021221 RepID=UPI0012B1BBC5|nr:uracil-DNA glycosylase [Rickettsiales endosymbiont of Trichoplax sp. H2]MSO14031.1 DNA polymerase [Rickettsiales endosymbiont of Trichoplax sp. H2]